MVKIVITSEVGLVRISCGCRHVTEMVKIVITSEGGLVGGFLVSSSRRCSRRSSRRSKQVSKRF